MPVMLPTDPPGSRPRRAVPWSSLPAGVWALGFSSLLMDTSSEMIHSLLPAFMVTALGASMVTLGLVEGIAEATAAFVKVLSGSLSDYLGRRKPPMVFGYALAALSKPLFPLAASVGWVFAARFIDRVGKGIRGAPRDALVAAITPPRLRGAAYGMRQALDSVGAVAGPLLALALMALLADDMRAVMWFAGVPAILTVVVLVVFVREPGTLDGSPATRRARLICGAASLPARYWLVVLTGAVFSLARFSEAFLVLRGRDVGLTIGQLPLVMVVMNLAFAGIAYPAGLAADRLSHRALLAAGLAVLILADLVLASARSPAGVYAGAALWGLHLALTQGLLSKLVADHAPADLHGTGFGIFNLVSGGALLLASLIAGMLWTSFGAAATFLAGAAFTATAMAGVVFGPRRPPPRAAG